MQLASKACVIYLDKILVSKSTDISISGGDEQQQLLFFQKDDFSSQLMSELDKFVQLRNDTQFQAYQNFFREAETFLSPLCGLKEFKIAILRLVPIYSYLDKITGVTSIDDGADDQDNNIQNITTQTSQLHLVS
jgi:hypothetical protein